MALQEQLRTHFVPAMQSWICCAWSYRPQQSGLRNAGDAG
jgi:hypothetical protein